MWKKHGSRCSTRSSSAFQPPSPPFSISFHFILGMLWKKNGLKQTVDMCGSKNALSAHTHARTRAHAHTHVYTHVYGERAVFFRREARLSLSHSISSWSYIRGQREHTNIPARRRCQDQKSDWLLYAAGEKDGAERKKREGASKGRERFYAGHLLNIMCVEIQKALYVPPPPSSTNSPIFLQTEALSTAMCSHLHL